MPNNRDILRAVAEWIAGFDDKPETEDVDFAGALVRFVSEQRRKAANEAVWKCRNIIGMCSGCQHRIETAFLDTFYSHSPTGRIRKKKP